MDAARAGGEDDATEVYRDLRNPAAALRWNQQAVAMSPGTHTRSVGLRMTVLATVHLQHRDLERGLALGNQAVDLLSRVASVRAREYAREVSAALRPWSRDQRVVGFNRRVRTELALAS
ncbi:MAG TPA: hypothetical protein VK545_10140 [Streptomyces sp.]|nr:hypothetical protein [Streptomyces sp.]